MTARQLAAEFVGTAMLLACVVGSGIMGERLAGGNAALALLANALATAAMLAVLIVVFEPISGAHFNPAVTLCMLLLRRIAPAGAAAYAVAQIAGAIAGTAIAHAMFDGALLEWGTKPRTGAALWFSEAVATAGLIGTILLTARHRPGALAATVSLYIGAAYWFTASTSFANPAAAIARGFTNSFSGIAIAHVPMFVATELAAALAATLLCRRMFLNAETHAGPSASHGGERELSLRQR